jgi:hypothetical protein
MEFRRFPGHAAYHLTRTTRGHNRAEDAIRCSAAAKRSAAEAIVPRLACSRFPNRITDERIGTVCTPRLWCKLRTRAKNGLFIIASSC